MITTMTKILSRLFSKVGKVEIGGTITAVGGDKARTPTFISNEGLGSPHIYDTLDDLANMPILHMQLGMSCTINQYTDANGKLIPRTKYTLDKLPDLTLYPLIERLSELPAKYGQALDLSLYWTLDKPIASLEGTMEVQYAPNCNKLTGGKDIAGSMPPFPNAGSKALSISDTDYTNLVEGTTVLIGSNNIAGYWSNDFDSTKNHVWMRTRYGNLSKWSIPQQISADSWKTGDYIENRFMWSVSKPDTPPQFIDTRPNSFPTGWEDTIPTKPATPNIKLWILKGQKDVFQNLTSAWFPPMEVKMDAELTRYNEVGTPHPDSLAYSDLTNSGWKEIYDSKIHKWIATREKDELGVFTAWVVRPMEKESGEYTEFVFRACKVSDVETILNNPDTYRPVGSVPQDWFDAPVILAADEIQLISTARKYSNKELIDRWSAPRPFTGQDTIVDEIEVEGGDNFKLDKFGVSTPAAITLTANLWKGISKLTPDSISWERIYNDGALDSTIFGTGASITIGPSDVTGHAIFKCTQIFGGITYTVEQSILDIVDGIDANVLILTADGQMVTQKIDGSYVPSLVTLRAISSNLSDGDKLKWYTSINGEPWIQVMSGGQEYLSDTLAVNTSADLGTVIEKKYKAVSEEGLWDTFSLYKIAEGANGAPATLMVLSNEQHNVILDESNGITNYTGATSAIRVFEGSTDVTGTWSFQLVETNCIGTFGTVGQAPIRSISNEGSPVVKLDSITGSSNTAYIIVNATKGTDTLSKQFSISRIKDPVGSIILDIDSDLAGFTFSKTKSGAKTLSAKLYVNNVATTAASYKWYIDGGTTVQSTGATYQVTRSLVNIMVPVSCEVTYAGKTFRRTINLTDHQDAIGRGILYSSNAGNLTNTSKPASSVAFDASSGKSADNTVDWAKLVTGAIWASDRLQSDSEWSNPYRIAGEKGTTGDPGAAGSPGNTIKTIFKRGTGTTAPSTPSGNLVPTGWSITPTGTNSTGLLWASIGEITPAGVLVGSWSAPTQFGGSDGEPGAAGSQGSVGPPGPPGPKGDNGDTGYGPTSVWKTEYRTGSVNTFTVSGDRTTANPISFKNNYAIKRWFRVEGMLVASADSSETDWVTLTLDSNTSTTLLPTENRIVPSTSHVLLGRSNPQSAVWINTTSWFLLEPNQEISLTLRAYVIQGTASRIGNWWDIIVQAC